MVQIFNLLTLYNVNSLIHTSRLCFCFSLMFVSIAGNASGELPEKTACIMVDTTQQAVSLQSHAIVTPLVLRTNLLMDMIGGPNLTIEVPVGNHFSFAIDFSYAYTQINNTYALKVIQEQIEGRYWFRQGKNVLTGWNVGVYASYCSRFDVQWDSGYQGDGFWSAGLSAGYSMPLSRMFNLDFSVSGGYLYLPEIRHYHKSGNGKLLWQETRYNVWTISLTGLKISLVWMLNVGKKKTK